MLLPPAPLPLLLAVVAGNGMFLLLAVFAGNGMLRLLAVVVGNGMFLMLCCTRFSAPSSSTQSIISVSPSRPTPNLQRQFSVA